MGKKISADVMEMHSGRYVNPLDLKREDVCWEDIVYHLARVLRFGGATDVSVLHHSLLVEYILYRLDRCPNTRLCGLFHDAAEAYVGDIPRPIKGQLAGFKECEDQVLNVIWEVLELPVMTRDMHKQVKEADNLALMIEGRELPSGGKDFRFVTKALRTRLRAMRPDLWYRDLSREECVARFRQVHLHLSGCDTRQYVVWQDDVLESTGFSSSPPEQGLKYDDGKLRLDLVSTYAVKAIAEVLGWAATVKKKYPERNWEKGIAYTRVMGALKRHLMQFEQREDTDDESGLSHVSHMLCCAHFLAHFVSLPAQYARFDDRPSYDRGDREET